jgi:hypothetical protein
MRICESRSAVSWVSRLTMEPLPLGATLHSVAAFRKFSPRFNIAARKYFKCLLLPLLPHQPETRGAVKKFPEWWYLSHRFLCTTCTVTLYRRYGLNGASNRRCQRIPGTFWLPLVYFQLMLVFLRQELHWVVLFQSLSLVLFKRALVRFL